MKKKAAAPKRLILVLGSLILIIVALVASLVLVSSSQDLRNQAFRSRCIPRPSCLDLPKPCKLREPVAGWCPTEKKDTPEPPTGCYYQQVQCVKAPCEPILVCDGVDQATCGNRQCEAGEADSEVCPSCPAGSKVCPKTACQVIKGSCPQDCRGTTSINSQQGRKTN